MTFHDLSWPGVGHSRKAINAARRKDAQLLKQVRTSPRLFKNAAKLQRNLSARIADYDAGLLALTNESKAHAVRQRAGRRTLADLEPKGD